MPCMIRITWDSAAIHQGYMTKRPASHEYVRLSRKFAKKLFGWVEKGTVVSVGGDTSRYDNYRKNGDYAKDRYGYSIIEVC